MAFLRYVIFLSLVSCLANAKADNSASHQLWYDAPAQKWTDALPLGNGRLGAMVFGGTSEARYQLNDDSLWQGAPRDYAHPGAAEVLPELRRLLFDGKQREAEQLASEHFMSVPLRQMAYQPMADLNLKFAGHNSATDYRRQLDLDTATATTSYQVDGVTFRRESFVSFPAQAIVVRLSADQPGKLSFAAGLSSPQTDLEMQQIDERMLQVSGKVCDAEIRRIGKYESKMRFATRLRVLHTDGKITASDESLQVADASTATLVVVAATNYVNFEDLSADPQALCAAGMQKVASENFEKLHAAHVADHQALYRRMQLELGTTEGEVPPTDQRLLRYEEQPDPDLEELLFHYGRYLMIASSRAGGQPANLQGLWNESLSPPWDSKYTTNINAEMNYWLTEPCNLAECNEPLFDALDELVTSGSRTAKVHYNARGWVLHHNFDLWRGTAPINASNHGIWPTGGAWFCQHLWWHYRYSGDEEFLRERAYPIMRSASEFFVDCLVEDPRTPEKWLISGPSNSPEQGGLVMGPTMDHQIIRNLFANTIAAAKVLDVDAELREQLEKLRERIAPNLIGQHGQLQEWLEDRDNPNNRHRHVSHLWGLFPGHEITRGTPKLLAAAQRSLEMRGDGGTGWSLAWKINLWARLGDGDHAYRLIKNLLRLTESPLTDNKGAGLYTNMFDAHPPFQIDGNFGATNGMCQLVVQSYQTNDEGLPIVEVLAALPSNWKKGSLAGVRVPGGVELDLAWENGKLESLVARSPSGGACCLQYGADQIEVRLAAGEEREL